MNKTLSLLAVCFLSLNCFGQNDWLGSFESTLTQPDTFYNGADGKGGIHYHKFSLSNSYDAQWKTWSGFSISSMRDTITSGYTNDLSAITGTGNGFSRNYAVMGIRGKLTLNKKDSIRGVYITNSTYAYRSMLEGDQFSKKFGGPDGNDKDFFRLTATGYSDGTEKSVQFYLADFTSPDNSKDYIIKDWTYFSLSELGEVDSIIFSLSSSDTGQWGMNTPAYFCMDDLNAVNTEPYFKSVTCDFEGILSNSDTFNNGKFADGGFYQNGYFFTNQYDTQWGSFSGFAISNVFDTTTADFSNQYATIAADDKPNTYLTAYQRASIYLPFSETHYTLKTSTVYMALKVANSTYAYHTMKDGNQFAKKFGGADGTDKDYLRLMISGVNGKGEAIDTIEHYLADYRGTNDYISRRWETVIIDGFMSEPLDRPVRLDFWIEGSDTGQWGLNTPAYFCIDDAMELIISSNRGPQSATVKVFPNPAKDVLNISSNDMNFDQYAIFNLVGEVVQTGEAATSIPLPEHLNGIYVLRLKSGESVISKKIIID